MERSFFYDIKEILIYAVIVTMWAGELMLIVTAAAFLLTFIAGIIFAVGTVGESVPLFFVILGGDLICLSFSFVAGMLIFYLLKAIKKMMNKVRVESEVQ